MNTFVNGIGRVGLGLMVMHWMFASVSDAKLTGPELLEAAVAIWTFERTDRNEENDPFVKDVSGNGHDAVMLNKPALVEGKFGKAVEFNAGRKNYLEVPHHEDFDLDEAISISVWVKRPPRLQALDTAPYFILEKGGEWQHGRPTFGIALHKVFNNMFYFWYKGGYQGVNGIKDDQWHHYVVVAKDRERDAAMYIDGELKEVEHLDGQRVIALEPSPGRALHIGAALPERFDSWTNNTIDDLAIFNVALSPADVERLGKGVDNSIFAVSPLGKLATTWAILKQSR
ncbi:hypothetical protein C6502_12235 [Candidatus Poribacteria bacterium]|nr:MAG: hypothetical protein C6502_12235 [Candidatus Poribacteria bacterium]